MATRLQKWMDLNVYKWIYMFVILDCSLLYVRGSIYSDSTQSTLCGAQCEALCLTEGIHCEQKCNGVRNWITDCDGPNCTGTCSMFSQSHYANKGYLPHVPDVTIKRTENTSLLSWNVPTELSPLSSHTPFAIIYIVEETHPHPTWPSIHSVSLKWVKETNFTINQTCTVDSYRVMAVNKYGSNGFSKSVALPAMHPGPVRNFSYAGSGVYYYNKKQAPPVFMAILMWEVPEGLEDNDIERYEMNPFVKRQCKDVAHDSLPIFIPLEHRPRHVLMSVSNISVNCIFMPQVRAVTKCNATGPWVDFKVDLTDCKSLSGYKCDKSALDPPGKIENVTLKITSTPIDQVLKMFANPYAVNNYTQSPLLINLHINWQPPEDKGSEGVIDHYIIRHGAVKRNYNPFPPSFVGEPQMIKVGPNFHELEFQLPTQTIPYTYGVQVIAVGPGQMIPPNRLNIYEIRTIRVSRNDSSIGEYLQSGKVLLDRAGLVILYIDNYVRVRFMFDQPMGRANNSTIDRLALQWGPLVGPDKMKVENRTIVPLNLTSLVVTLKQPHRSYGVKVMYLVEDEEDPVDDVWDEMPVLTFTLPQISDVDPDANSKIPEERLVPLYITLACVSFAILIGFGFRYLLRRRHFKHLERRLLIDDIIEEGEHYFVMRPSDNGSADDIPTVVADQWELPHCCLKMGRILGSGAFGQVLKGRVSKTMLVHRGIGGQTVQHSTGTHVTVAIKMLQDNADARHTENFIKEIEMMKDIGYHRNVLSILGCCTLRQPYCLVVENMSHGDLQDYLRNIRNHLQERESSGEGYINQDIDMFTPRDLLSVARQITTGMEYLSQKGYVHRDLAARNVLVGDNKTVKIGDFGLARYIYQDTNKNYVTRRGGKLPLRWMSPEAIFNMTFSIASDIWSFGILLYEIVTLAGAPYPSLSNIELLQALKNGYRMKRPDNCCQEIYQIMLDCWEEDAGSRPSFTDLCRTFTSMLEEETYTEYFNFDVPLDHDYYSINSDGMDTDFPDFDDPRIPTSIETLASATCLTPRDKKIVKPTFSQMVTTEIPDCNCTVTNRSSTNQQEDRVSYTDQAFATKKYKVSVSSFDNELYAAMIANHNNQNDKDRSIGRTDSPVSSSSSESHDLHQDGTILGNAKNLKLPSTFTRSVENTPGSPLISSSSESTPILPLRFIRPVEERVSASSDEVFTCCLECDRMNSKRKLDNTDRGGHKIGTSGLTQCPDCGRLDFHLSPYDIHVTDRNDSAVCSTASDDSDQSHSNQSESSATMSDVYLMPDSPTNFSNSSNAVTKSDVTATSRTFDFSQSDSSLQLGVKDAWISRYPNFMSTVGCPGYSKSREFQELKDIDQFLLEQGKAEQDIWFISQTKF